MSERMYLLKVRLLDIEHEILRRFVVPASITLDRIHDVIQIVMGWTDSHLHEFTIGKKRYTEYPQERGDGLQNEIACLDGARACPPEDVGGIPGYFDSE